MIKKPEIWCPVCSREKSKRVELNFIDITKSYDESNSLLYAYEGECSYGHTIMLEVVVPKD